jgi:quercetin dioxygenase-like cupin family protein
MNQLAASGFSLALLAAASAAAEGIKIMPNGSRPTVRGAEQNFSGSVVVNPLFGTTDHTNTTAGHVSFEPGARSAWHTHPAGQTLIVTAGLGWIQEWNGTKREIRPGDVIWIAPGVKHWHGATATQSMSHIAVTDVIDGRNVDWLEKVSDAQYQP